MAVEGIGIELDAIRELQKQGFDDLQTLEIQCYADDDFNETIEQITKTQTP